MGSRHTKNGMVTGWKCPPTHTACFCTDQYLMETLYNLTHIRIQIYLIESYAKSSCSEDVTTFAKKSGRFEGIWSVIEKPYHLLSIYEHSSQIGTRDGRNMEEIAEILSKIQKNGLTHPSLLPKETKVVV